MHEQFERYFIGVAVSGRQKEAVDGLREKIADAFGVRGALTSPPHITLFYPFETKDPGRLVRHLRSLADSSVPFSVLVTGFAAFDEAVWFLEPAQDPALFALRREVAVIVKDVIGLLEKESRRDPHFHITLAYKDVSPETHRRIAAFLQSAPLPIDRVMIENIVLFRLRPDRTWEPMKSFSFGGVR